MAATVSVDEVARLAAQLSSAERLQLVRKIHELGSSTAAQAPAKRRKWREIRGLVDFLLCGDDAQAWVTTSRRESDKQRAAP